MSLISRDDAPTAADAEHALGGFRDQVLARLQGMRPEGRLAFHGVANGVEDVIVTIRRLATHERVWRESHGTKPVEPPLSDNPNQNAMQQMVRARADLRSFILLTDVLLDDATKALRPLGASVKATESFFALAKHLSGGGAEWSQSLLPLTAEIVGLQHSLGYFRDKFIAHRGLLPATAIYLPDGKVRLQLVPGTKSDADRERAGREVAELLPVPDMPLDPVYDVRLDLAFAALRHVDPELRARLGTLLEEFGAVSPDSYETAVEVAQTLGAMFAGAVEGVPPSPV